MSINQLRDSGLKVRVHHRRLYKGQTQPLTRKEYEDMNTGTPYCKAVLPRGGITEISVTTPEGKEVEASAACSAKDAFSRKKGVTIAVGRLNKLLHVGAELTTV